jgi:hypothetical protein
MVESALLDALAAVADGLLIASLGYFFYLLLRYSEMPHVGGHEGDRRPTPRERANCIAPWLGEPEHGRPLASGTVRFGDSA